MPESAKLRTNIVSTMWIGAIVWQWIDSVIHIACGDNTSRTLRQPDNRNRTNQEELPKGGCERYDLQRQRTNIANRAAAIYRMEDETEQEAWFTLGQRPDWMYGMNWWKSGNYTRWTNEWTSGQPYNGVPVVEEHHCQTRGQGGYYWIVEYDPRIDTPHSYHYDEATSAWTLVPPEDIVAGYGRTKWLPFDSREWRDDHWQTLWEINNHGMFQKPGSSKGQDHRKGKGYDSSALAQAYLDGFNAGLRTRDQQYDHMWDNSRPPKRPRH